MAPKARSKADQFRAHWADEIDAPATYRALARRAAGERRDIRRELAAAEERHAAHWAAKLVELGEPAPDAGGRRPGRRARLLSWAAGHFGLDAVLPVIER